jgi:hypothetical protein
MSRINYSDEEDYPGQFNLWQANCMRSIKGKAGQAALRELEQALLALPEKRLIADELEDADGEVCAIGALAKYRNVTPKSDPEEMEMVGVELGMPEMVAWKIVCLNDMELDRRWDREADKMVDITPEERYERVLAQVRKWIMPPLEQRIAAAIEKAAGEWGED